jgi:hypothetical protein
MICGVPTGGRVRQGPDQPQQAVATDDHAQGGGQPRPGPSGQRQPDRCERAAQRPGPAGPRGRQSGNLLGERARRASGVVAEEPTDPQHDLDRAAADRRVGETAAVTAVHPRGGPLTPDALRDHGTNPRCQPHPTRTVTDIVEHEGVEMGQQPRSNITWR